MSLFLYEHRKKGSDLFRPVYGMVLGYREKKKCLQMKLLGLELSIANAFSYLGHHHLLVGKSFCPTVPVLKLCIIGVARERTNERNDR